MRIFIGIKQYVPPIIFVVTAPSAQVCKRVQHTNSLAHLYGTNANIFGLAHFDKSKGELICAILINSMQLWYRFTETESPNSDNTHASLSAKTGPKSRLALRIKTAVSSRL